MTDTGLGTPERREMKGCLVKDCQLVKVRQVLAAQHVLEGLISPF
jgi:hypothetical protein